MAVLRTHAWNRRCTEILSRRVRIVKTLFLIALAASTLAGCVVAPAYPAYPYGYAYGPAYVYPSPGPGYYYRHGYYYPYGQGYYWRQAP
jgi:hypothetical protein